MLKHLQLFENYAEQKEMEELVRTILWMMTDDLFQRYSPYIQTKRFKGVYLNDINPTHFPTLRQFMRERRELVVRILDNDRYDGDGTFGSYIISHDPTTNKEYYQVQIRQREESFTRVFNYLTYWQNNEQSYALKAGTDELYKIYGAKLMHEMQHAFDDWRSKRNAIRQGSDNKERLDKFVAINQKDLADVKEEEHKFVHNYLARYLNFKHEVDARFAAAIATVKFFDWDFEASCEVEKDVYKLASFRTVLREFKYKMENYKDLTPKHKRRVLTKLGQYYEREREFLVKKNAEAQPWESKNKG